MTLQIPVDYLSATIPDGVLRPGDPGYAEAATTLTGEGTPDLVVRPRTAQEVAAAVRFARGHRLPVTVRAGGHSMAGRSTVPGGLLVDLRRIDGTAIDPGTRLVRVGGGATWGAVAAALEPHGLGLTAGDTATVGVGGLTLGGGIGWLVRRDGLAVDHLVGAEVVTADGQVLEVSAREHPELFWALRGGGGGFGVVTRFDFVAQPVREVLFGSVVLALEDPHALVTAWHAHQHAADERLTTELSLIPPMGERPATAALGLCFTGGREEGAAVVDPLLRMGTVLSSDVAVRPYATVLAEAHHPPGTRVTIRSALLPELDDAARRDVAGLVAAGSVASLRSLGGAFGRVPEDTTAFAHRSADVMVVTVNIGGDDDGQEPPEWAAVASRGTGGYVNFDSTTGEGAVSAAYPSPTRRRLEQVKATYDPSGLFRGVVALRPTR